VRQRLVRTHRHTGRKSLYLSSHAGRIVGWPVPEAMLLLRELTEHATQREFVYSHRWRVGDLVMWPYDDASRAALRGRKISARPPAHDADGRRGDRRPTAFGRGLRSVGCTTSRSST
jgi:alpha-ketoglutarate-dependent 2,4-dichlorophenoxyacetate dioxygenase